MFLEFLEIFEFIASLMAQDTEEDVIEFEGCMMYIDVRVFVKLRWDMMEDATFSSIFCVVFVLYGKIVFIHPRTFHKLGCVPLRLIFKLLNSFWKLSLSRYRMSSLSSFFIHVMTNSSHGGERE